MEWFNGEFWCYRSIEDIIKRIETMLEIERKEKTGEPIFSYDLIMSAISSDVKPLEW